MCIAGQAGKSQGARLKKGLAVAVIVAAACVGALLVAGEPRPVRGKQAVSGGREKLRTERYEIDVRFEPEKSFLHAKAAVTLRASQFVEAIEFELNPRLHILEVTDPQGRKLEFTRSGRIGSPKLLVRLIEPCGAEQGVTLTFVYEGVLPPRPMDYITKDGILLRDESRWYPAVDISDFAHHRITVVMPHDWFVFAPGDGGVQALSKPKAHSYSAVRPVSSRALIAMPHIGASALPGCVHNCDPNISAVVRTPNSRNAPALASTTKNVFEFLKELIGGPKIGRFHILEGFPKQSGIIGYSAPGTMLISEDVVKWHDLPGYAPQFLPHEVAHQWFPIEVTIAREEDGWLAESIAEYLAWRYLQERDRMAARAMVARAMRDAPVLSADRPLALGLHLFREGNEVAYPVLYQRGMLVWRTLETVIGRERVDAALRLYYKRFAGRPASIADFRRVCEEISGRDLEWFFEFYLKETQIPEISVQRAAASAPHEFAGEIVVKNAPAGFQARVELRLETASGPVSHSVATSGEMTPFTVTVPSAVQRVAVDPDLRILRWTEPARRYRLQKALLNEGAEAESSGRLAEARQALTEALAEDPENLTHSGQQIRFVLGQVEFRAGRRTAATASFRLALGLSSLSPVETDFYRAWARVYLARMARQRGEIASAKRHARAGLALKPPALETPVLWPGEGRERTAAQELRRLAP